MWFLGAGASASAGIPTAGDMIWDFKRTIFSIQNKISIRLLSDLANPIVQQRIQQFLDSNGTFPAAGSDEEYARYFEEVYPTEADRRTYVDRLISSGTPAYGHLALAALMRLGKAKIVWTTNFDRVIEDANFRVYGSSKDLIVATLDKATLATEAMNEGRFPILGKLHGDFQSRRLKNTPNELQSQDTDLRHALVEGCKRYGLVVMGYSGRDRSIVEALEMGIADGKGYPAGLYWCHRADSPPTPSVAKLLSDARAAGIQAEAVEVETFDECLADILNLVDVIPLDITRHLASMARRITDAPPTEGEPGFPLVRLNAVPIISAPLVCRRITCDIGGTKEVKQAIEKSGGNIVAARRNVGVLAFGRDEDIKNAFGPYKIKDFDLHSIEPNRLTFESAELGLIYTALQTAFTRRAPVIPTKKHGRHMLVVDHERDTSNQFKALRSVTSALGGTIPGTDVKWAEAASLRIESYCDRLWLVIEPTVWSNSSYETPGDKANIAKEFIRARRASRFNLSWNRVLDAWLEALLGTDKEVKIASFGISDGVDAAFTLMNASAYSPRQRKLK